jgi:hypothetical protein
MPETFGVISRSENMDMCKQERLQGGTGSGGSRRVVSVGLPDPHAGVVNALRASFDIVGPDMPADIMALLRKLDRF